MNDSSTLVNPLTADDIQNRDDSTRFPLGYFGSGMSIRYIEDPDTRAVDVNRALFPETHSKHSWWRADQIDTDPTGESTEQYGRLPGVDKPYTRTDVLSVNLIGGRQVSRERLMYELGPEGRALLAAVANGRKNGRYDAVEALDVSTWHLSDFFPGTTFLARVNGSFGDAARLNKVLDKIANGEPISEREGALVTLDMYVKDRKNKGTIAGRGWDIARDAVPMMMEFYATGGLLGAVRSTAAKTVGKTSVAAAELLAIPTVEVKLARELATDAVAKTLAKSGSSFATKAAARSYLTSAPVRGELIDKLTSEMLPRITSRMGGLSVHRNANFLVRAKSAVESAGTFHPEFIEAVTKNMATRAADGAIASATRSNAFTKWASGTATWAKDHIIRGMLDHGSWADETASTLYTGFTSAKSALADAVGQLFVQAPIKGALMWAPNQYLVRPLVEKAVGATDADGNPLELAGRQQIELKTSAILEGNRRKFDMAKQISDGIDFLEYVSESTGSGFSSFWNFAGIASRIAKPAQRVLTGELGSGMVRNMNVETGSALRKMLRRVAGTTEQYGEKVERTQVKSVAAYLEGRGITGVDEAAIRDMVRTGTVPRSISAVVGHDADRLISTAVKQEATRVADDDVYHAYARYVVADMMFRNGWGVDATIDGLRQMGYNGMINEMMEERYSEVAQGLFGVNAHNDRTFMQRLSRAWETLEKDPEKLAVEAFGFAIPGVTRNMALMTQTALGGPSEVNRARSFGVKMRRAKSGMNVVEASAQDYVTGMTAARKNMEKSMAEAEAELKSTEERLRANNVDDATLVRETSGLRDRIDVLNRRLTAHDDNMKTTLSANGITDVNSIAANFAGKLINFAVVSTDFEDGTTRDRLRSVFTAKDVELANTARNDVVEDAAWMGEASYDAQNRWLGESNDSGARQFWRRAASKIVGFTAAFICGDPALAATNAIDWASVDEGSDPVTVSHLREMFATFRSGAIRKFQHEGRRDFSETELRDSFRADYEKEARRYVNSVLLLHGLRMFSHTEMEDLAVHEVARNAGYSWNSSTSMYETTENGVVKSVTRESLLSDPTITVVDRSGQTTSVGKAVDKLVGDVSSSVVQMLSDPEVFAAVKSTDARSDGFYKFLRMKPGDPAADMTAHCLAASMSSFRSKDVWQAREIVEGVPIDQMLSENCLRVPRRVVNDVCSAFDKGGYDAVSSAAVEEIMRTIPGDTLGKPTDKAFADRVKKVVDLCRVVKAASDMYPERVFSVSVDLSKNRHYDSNGAALRFYRNPKTGKWRISGRKYNATEASKLLTTEFTDEQLTAEYLSNSLGGTRVTELDTGYVLTPFQTIVSSDPMLLARKLGLGPSLYKAGIRRTDGKLDDSAVHPALRLNDKGESSISDADLDAVLQEELFKANFYRDHENDIGAYNFEKRDLRDEKVMDALHVRMAEYKKTYEDVLADRTGYMWRLDNALMKAGVVTPKSSSLFTALTPGARGLYILPTSMYHAASSTAETFVPVDFSRAQDGIAAMAASIVSRSVIANRNAFVKGGVFHDYVTEFLVSFRSHADAAIFNPDTAPEMRTKLIAARDSLAANPEHPIVSSIAQLASAYVLGQISRAEASGHRATYHDEALAYLRKDVMSDFRPYIKFCAAIDVALGGSGFSQLRAMGKAGSDVKGYRPDTGITWLYSLLNSDPAAVENASRAFREIIPAGMDGRSMGWDEFTRRAGEYLTSKVKSVNDVKPLPQVKQDENVHPWVRALRVIEKSGFSNEDDVWAFLDQIFAPSGIMDSKMPGSAAAYHAARVRRESALVSVRQSLDTLNAQVASQEAEIARLREASKDSGTEISRLLEEKTANESKIEELQKTIEELQKTVQALSEGGESRVEVKDEVKDEDEDENIDDPDSIQNLENLDEYPEMMLESTYDFSRGDLQDVSLDFADGVASVSVVRDVEFTCELDYRALRYGSVIVDSAAQYIIPGHAKSDALDEDQFKRTIDVLTNGVATDDLKNRMWNTYTEVVLPSRKASIDTSLDDPVVDVELDQDDEGEQSNEKNEYNKSTLSMYDNKVLGSFLQFAELVSPENGRELQGLLNSVRDTTRRMLDEVEDNPGAHSHEWSTTVRHMFDLFNPRAIDRDGLEGQVDRDALYYNDILGDFEKGADGVDLDAMLRNLLDDGNGNPRSRKIAFFVLYLRSLSSGARKRFMELVGHSAQTRRFGITPNRDGSLTLVPSRGRAQSVSEYAATASFGRLLMLKGDCASVSAKASKMAEDLKAIAIRAVKDGRFSSDGAADNMNDVADVLSEVLGEESPIVQALRSQTLKYTFVDRGRLGMELRGAFEGVFKGTSANGTAPDLFSVPDAIRSAIDIISTYSGELGSNPSMYTSQSRRRELLSNIVLTEMQAGISTSSSRSANKTSAVSTVLRYILGAYSASLPETVARANTIVTRNSKIGSKVVVSVPSNPPILQKFMDRGIDDKSGFAYIAYHVWLANDSYGGAVHVNNTRFDGKATDAELKEHFVKKILPECRQRMVWPDAVRRSIMAKNIDRDYTAKELYEANENYFNDGLKDTIGSIATAQSEADRTSLIDRATKDVVFVPVYSGEHSSGFTLQVPVSALYVPDGLYGSLQDIAGTTYRKMASKVYKMLGFDQFGSDAKRSAISSCEIPGHSLRGIHARQDGSLVKGEVRLHVIHNYGLDDFTEDGKSIKESFNDGFLGSVFATGYGFDLQKEMAKDPYSSMLKLHIMSSLGRDLTLYKSLITAMSRHSGDSAKYAAAIDSGLAPSSTSDGRRRNPALVGQFGEDSAPRAIMDHMMSGRKDDNEFDRLSSDIALDEDSVKVGVLNSKVLGVRVTKTGKDGKPVVSTEPLMKYVFRRILETGNAGKDLDESALDRILADGSDGMFTWQIPDPNSSDGKTTTERTTIGKLLHSNKDTSALRTLTEMPGDIRVKVVKGIGTTDRPVIDLSFVDNTLASHRVANVSHDAVAKPGKMARNNAVDAITLASLMKRAGAKESLEQALTTMLNVLSGWNILTASAATDALTQQFLMDSSDRIRTMMMEQGAAAGSDAVIDQLAHDVFSKLVEDRNPSVNQIQAALVSSGARIDADGNFRDHCTDPFLRYIHRGGKKLSKANSNRMIASHRCGLAQINVRNPGFRYMMFIDQTKIRDAYDKMHQLAVSHGIDEAKVPASSGIGEILESMFNMVRKADARHHAVFIRIKSELISDPKSFGANHAEQMDNFSKRLDEAGLQGGTGRLSHRGLARALRELVMSFMVDHHGISMEGRRRLNDGRDEGVVAYETGFDDLFIERIDGSFGFDRTAVLTDVPLPKGVLGGSGTGVALAGTMIGIPRTPSYNGSMWSSNARASIPATEISYAGGKLWEVGHDAIVMPDAQLLRIQGCDNDGDKSACYMYNVNAQTGVAEFLGAPDELLPKGVKNIGACTAGDDPYAWARDPVKRREYLDDMVSAGYVSLGAKVTDVDEDTGATRSFRKGYEVNHRARVRAGNSIVRGLFSIAARREMSDVDDSDHDLLFGGRYTRETKPRPVDDKRWKELKKLADDGPFNYLRNGTIGDPYVAMLVSSSAQAADKARGYAVSYARRLHLAIMSGAFNENSPIGSLFSWKTGSSVEAEKARLEKWLDFIYGVDGISNATFDDIKEQICLKMGWSPGMLETLFVELMFSERRKPDGTYERIDPPVTEKEMYDILSRYVKDINSHGAKFHMMISSNPENSDYELYREGSTPITVSYLHNTYRDAFGGSFSRRNLWDVFGLVKDPTGSVITVDETRTDASTAALRRFASELEAQVRKSASSVPGRNRSEIEARVRSALIGLVDNCSRGGGSNATVGYVYWAADQIKKSDDAAEAIVADYIRQSEATAVLKTVKDFTDSFNCFDANPGSGLKTGTRDEMAKTFTDTMSEMSRVSVKTGSESVMYSMFVGNMVSYNVEDLMTSQGRASLAASSRDSALLRWGAIMGQTSVHPALKTYIASLAAEDSESPNQLMRLEGSLRTKPYFLGALRSIPTLEHSPLNDEGSDLFSGNHGLAAWDAMEAIARATSFYQDPLSDEGTPATRTVTNADGTTSSYALDGDSQSTVSFLSGVCSMFNVLQHLVATSRAPYLNPGLFYFSTRKDYDVTTDKSGTGDSAWVNAAAKHKDLIQIRGLRRIVSTMRDKSRNSRRIAYNAIEGLSRLNSRPRVRAFDNEGARSRGGEEYSSTFAKSFALTIENMDGLLKELGDTSGIKSRGNLPTIVDDINTVKRILSALQELNVGPDGANKPVTITASGFVKQILPLYATLTSITGPADPKSASILAYLPGVYNRISAEQAMYSSGELERRLGVSETPGRTLIDLLVATRLGLVTESDKDSGRGNDPLVYSKMTPDMRDRIINELSEAYGKEHVESLFASMGEEDFGKLMSGLTKDGTRPVRINPDKTHIVDALSGLQPIRSLHEFINSITDGTVGRPDKTTVPSAKDSPSDPGPADPGEFSSAVDAAVGWLRAALGHSADIEYTGGGVATIRFRGGLRGTAPLTFTGSADGRADLAITVRFGSHNSPGKFKVDINSPYTAASFCQAASGLGITADQFLTLTRDERRAMISAFTKGALDEDKGAAGYSLSMPSWSLDENKVATLCGEIRIRDPKNRKALFHEYFHSMIGAFRTLGMFSQQDIDMLAVRFPKKARGTLMLFDEEAAADAFAAYVERRIIGSAEAKDSSDTGLRKLWNKIIGFLKSLRAMFKMGFGYSTAEGRDDPLFQFVLNGYAAQSKSRLSEVGLSANSEYLTDEAGRFTSALKIAQSFKSGIERDRTFIEKLRTDNPAAEARRRADAAVPEYADPAARAEKRMRSMNRKRAAQMKNGEKNLATSAEYDLSMLLLNELRNEVPNYRLVSKLVTELSTFRKTGGFSVAVSTAMSKLDASVDAETAAPLQLAASDDPVKEGRDEIARTEEYASSTDGKAWSRAVLRDTTTDPVLKSLLTDASASEDEIVSAFTRAYPETGDVIDHLSRALGIPADRVSQSTDFLMWRIAHQEALKTRVPAPESDSPASPNEKLGSFAPRSQEKVRHPGATDRRLDNLLRDRYSAMIVLDTETTGLFTHRNRLTQLTAYRVEQDATGRATVTGSVNVYVKLPSGFRADPGSLETSGLTVSDLDGSRRELDGISIVDESGSSEAAIERLEALVGDQKVLFVAHNAKFDSGTLLSAFSRAGRAGRNIISSNDWLDTETVFRDRATFDFDLQSGKTPTDTRVGYRADGGGTFVKKNRKGEPSKYFKGHTMEAMMSRYGITRDYIQKEYKLDSSAHRSDFDAAALLECVKRLNGERADLHEYVNIFGYHPNYGVVTSHDPQDPSPKDSYDSEEANYGRMAGVLYVPQWSPNNLAKDSIVKAEETLPRIVRSAFAGTQAKETPPAAAPAQTAGKPRPSEKRATLNGGEAYEFVPPTVEAAEAARRVLSEINSATLADPVTEDLREEFYDENYYLLGVGVRAAYDMLDEDDRRVLSGSNLSESPAYKLRAAINSIDGCTPKSTRMRERLARMDEVAVGAVNLLDRISGKKDSSYRYNNASTLAVLYKLWDDGFFKQAAERAFQRRERYVNGSKKYRKDSGDAYRYFVKHTSSKNDIAAAMLTAAGSRFGSLVENALTNLRGYQEELAGAESSDTVTVNHLVSELEKLLARMSPTDIMSDPGKWYASLDSFCRNVFSGIDRGAYDPNTGEYGPYVPNTDRIGDDESIAARNRAIYNLPGSADIYASNDPGVKFRQRAIQMVADAVFTTAAQVKFCREIGWHPGTVMNSVWDTKNVTAETFALTTKWLGLGSRQLTSADQIIENSCTPEFVAVNLDSLIESSVCDIIGRSGLRDLVLSKSRALRGHMSNLTRLVNLLDTLVGIDRKPGSNVLKLKTYKTTHKYERGAVKALDEDEREEVWGFDNFHGFIRGSVASSLTQDEYRTQALLANLARVVMQGDRRLITGIDEVRFNTRMFVRKDDTTGKLVPVKASDFDWYELNRRREDFRGGSAGRALNAFELALWKIGLNWHGFVTGIADPKGNIPGKSMNLYGRFVDVAIGAANDAFAMMRSGTEMNEDQFNDYVLSALEREGLLVSFSAKDEPGAEKSVRSLRRDGVVCIDVDLFKDAYVGSSGYAKLVDPKQGNRKPEMLTPEYIADRLGSKIREVWRELRNQPWMTASDMAFLNDFKSVVPAFSGTGAFMAGLRRAESDYLKNMSSAQVEAVLTRHEDTFRNMLSAPGMATMSYKDLTPAQLDMIHDSFRTKERGSELMRAFDNGVYARGSEASEATGLVIDNGVDSGKSTDFAGIVQQMYANLLEKYMSILEGRFTGDRYTELSVGRMLREYETAAAESTGASIRAMGMTDTQLYKRHHMLPANMTAGHAVMTMMRGLQNSLYFRSTLISMLFTPSEDGLPTFYADPGSVGPEAQVVPDEVWGMLAKWWSDANGLETSKDPAHRYKYDIKRSGVENARMAYRAISGVWANSGKEKIGDADYVEMSSGDLNSGTVSHMLVRVGTKDSTILDKIGTASRFRDAAKGRGSVALGYVKHLFQSQRTYAPGAVMKTLRHLTAWSKTMSVSLSVFFNVATQWESAIGATGTMATLMSNPIPFLPDIRGRKSPKSAKRKATGLARLAQKWATLGRKEGWIDENFIGFQDVIRMMDTDDPFLADLIMWAESIGITMSDTLNNPMEPDKPVVMKDLERLGDLLRPLYKSRGRALAAEKAMYEALLGKDGVKELLKARTTQAGKLAAKGVNMAVNGLTGVFNALITRRGEKAFNYALNAVKLSVAAQVAMRLKSEAVAAGRSFDPIRDMTGYAEYIDSEIGGVNPLRYAWAHPGTTRFLNILFFSWQWTRTAWEAGGGGIIEDMMFGGHSASKQQRGITLSRWARMFIAVQVAFPMLLQLMSKALGIACGYDDDRDKWWTFQNEEKSWLFNANLRPLLMAVSNCDKCVSDYFGLPYDHTPGRPGGYLAELKTSGPLVVRLALSIIPMYTGSGASNTTGRRILYGRIGKQATEFPKWFNPSTAFPQFFSKLSLTMQGILKTALGVNPSSLGVTGVSPDAEFVPVANRMLPFSTLTDKDGGNRSVINPDFWGWTLFVQPMSPFSLATIEGKGDAGALGLAMPIQSGTSQSVLRAEAVRRLRKYALNENTAYGSWPALTGGLKDDWRGVRKGPRSMYVDSLVADLRDDAYVNGMSSSAFEKNVLNAALTELKTKIYAELTGLLPENANDTRYSIREINRRMRAAVRLGSSYDDIASSINDRMKNRNRGVSSPKYFRLINAILRGSYEDPYGFDRRKLDRRLSAEPDVR